MLAVFRAAPQEDKNFLISYGLVRASRITPRGPVATTQRSRECSEPSGGGRLLSLAIDDLAESQNLTSEAHQMVSALGVIADNNPAIFPKLEAICAVLEKSINLNADSSEALQEFRDSKGGA